LTLAFPALRLLLVVVLMAGGALSTSEIATAEWGDHRFALRVLNRDGSPAPDGTVVILIRPIPREERRQIELTGVGPPACAVLTVQGGFAHFEPKVSHGCPDRTLDVATVDYKDGTYPIVSRIEPRLEWDLEVPEGSARVHTVRPVPPNT
jgi:hypothetical protein